MKALVLPCLLSAVSVVAQTTHTISTVGTTFSPSLVNAVVGDQIHLSISNPHTFTEVDEATWNANDNTSNGGLNFTAGEHDFTVTEEGTIWYVCIPHASMGMKGRIIVSTNTGVNEQGTNTLSMAPNPATDVVRFAGVNGTVRVELRDLKGALALARTITDGTLEVSSMAAGTYICEVRNLDGTVRLREKLTVRR